MAVRQFNKIWLLVIGLALILVFYIGSTYNQLVKQDEQVKLSWGDLQNTYQRRTDLIPSLVAVVKGSSDYEKQTLEGIAEARAKAQQTSLSATTVNAENYNAQEQAQAGMVQSVNKVIGIIEKYPDIKSTKSYVYLQSQLEGTERRIKVARNDFNAAVAGFNKKVRGFPSSLVAMIFGFKPKEGFKSDIGADVPPEVKF